MNLSNEILNAFPSAAKAPAPMGKTTKAAKGPKAKAARVKKAAAKVLDARKQQATAAALKSWASHEMKAVGALVNVFVACIEGGSVTPDMLAKHCPRIGASSRPVYSSRFNLAGKVSAIIGAEATGGVIERAVNSPGKAWENIIAALSAVRNAANAGGVKLATDAQRETFTEEANAAVEEKQVSRKAKKAATPRAQNTATLAKAAIAAGGDVRDVAALLRNLSAQAHGRMSAPEGREAQFNAARKALAAACEAWQILVK